MSNQEVAELPVAEKLRLMESLWDSLSRDAEAAVVPDWHQGVLAERAQRIDRCEEPSSSWTEAKQRIRQQNGKE